jgi:cytochrome P450
MLLHLALAPALLVSLRSTPALAPAVVSETLRLESPVQKICRWAVNDLELSREHRLHRGENAVLLVGAANRDPTRFENPDRMDLSRVQVPHLAFGKGVHACIGRGLAMMEGEAVLRWLIDNVDAIGLEEGAAEWIENSSFRGLKRLPITLRG